jgi:hypothetical protein
MEDQVRQNREAEAAREHRARDASRTQQQHDKELELARENGELRERLRAQVRIKFFCLLNLLYVLCVFSHRTD